MTEDNKEGKHEENHAHKSHEVKIEKAHVPKKENTRAHKSHKTKHEVKRDKEKGADTITINKVVLWQIISAILIIILVATNLDLRSSAGETQENVVTTGVGTDGRAFKGVDDAKVTIVEYSSFSCGFCNRVRPTIDQILNAYEGDVRFVYKHFDRGGTDSMTGQAVECAGEQGKFWEMHDSIFDNGASNLEGQAENIGLDVTGFSKCLNSGKYASRVAEDTIEGQELGARGTPTFLINGELVVGAQPFSAFETVIDAALEE